MGKMKIKAKKGKAKVQIKHDMLTYDQAKKKGVEANFITHISATVGDKTVFEVSTSQFLSKNPLIKFPFVGNKGEKIVITYTDLSGKTVSSSKKIK